MIVIKNFFAFWPDVDPSTIFPWLGAEHIVAMLIVALLLWGMFLMMDRLSPKGVQTVLKCAAIAIPVSEILRIIWLVCMGETNVAKLLPLHLCGTQVLFIPLAVFTKSKAIRDYTYMTAIVGGFTAIIYPIGIADTYPIWHFQTIQSLFLHALLILVPICFLRYQNYRPDHHNYFKVMGILLTNASVALAVDLLFDQNYMFLNEVPDIAPLVYIYDHFGHAGYILFMVIFAAAACWLMYLPFRIHAKKQLVESHANA